MSGDEAADAEPVAGGAVDGTVGDGAGVSRADAAGTRGAEDGDGDAPTGEASGDEARDAIEAGKGEGDAATGEAVGAGAAMMSASKGMIDIAT